MTFHPLPGKGEQETQEESNDNVNNISPFLISSGPLHHCVGGALQGSPLFTNGQAEVSSLLQAFLAGGGICFPHVRSPAGRTLMPAQRLGADPLTFARRFPPSLALAFCLSHLIPGPDWSVAPKIPLAPRGSGREDSPMLLLYTMQSVYTDRGPQSGEENQRPTLLPPRLSFTLWRRGGKDTTTKTTFTDVSLGTTKFTTATHPFPGAGHTAAGARGMMSQRQGINVRTPGTVLKPFATFGQPGLTFC